LPQYSPFYQTEEFFCCSLDLNINTTIKITSVCDGDAWSVGGGRGWLAGDTDGLAGWPVTGDSGHGQPASSRC